MSQKSILLAAIVTAVGVATGNVQQAEAVSINFRTLEVNEPQVGSVPSGNNVDNSANWEYFRFSGEQGESRTVTVRRIDQGLDPAFAVWEGLASDTAEFSSIFNDGNTLRQIAFADDEIGTPGPFGDPRSRFLLPSTGDYTLGVTSFLSEDSSEPFAYRVPEPLTLLGSLAAIGMGVLLKREYSYQSESRKLSK